MCIKLAWVQNGNFCNCLLLQQKESFNFPVLVNIQNILVCKLLPPLDTWVYILEHFMDILRWEVKHKLISAAFGYRWFSELKDMLHSQLLLIIIYKEIRADATCGWWCRKYWYILMGRCVIPITWTVFKFSLQTLILFFNYILFSLAAHLRQFANPTLI